MTWPCQKGDKVCHYVEKKTPTHKLGNIRNGNESKLENVIRPIPESIVFLEHYGLNFLKKATVKVENILGRLQEIRSIDDPIRFKLGKMWPI